MTPAELSDLIEQTLAASERFLLARSQEGDLLVSKLGENIYHAPFAKVQVRPGRPHLAAADRRPEGF